MKRASLIYPAPTIIIGVGRFGLATMERLAEDWQRLELSSDDPAVKNLRMVYVRPQRDADPVEWRKAERQYVDIARYTGDGDLPSLALDMVILRSLGLIRYRNGTYQVAMPHDGGIVEKGDQHRVVRRRYFDWLPLHPDPVASVERLEALVEKRPKLGLFIRPLINRARQGHSPRILLRAISRTRAHAEGRDPSPWVWFNDYVRQKKLEALDERVNIEFEPDWLTRDDMRGLLEGFAAEPVAGWSDWFKKTHHDWIHDVDVDDIDHFDERFDISIPAPFLPGARDLPSPLVPASLLRVDWETNGWATEAKSPLGQVEFIPVDSSPYRLGLFDHDDSSRVHSHRAADFADRLRLLGVHAHRGLVRLWVDLQRNRVEDQAFHILDARRIEGIDETLRQSLEVVGELIVRPLLDESHDSKNYEIFPEQRDNDWVDGDELPDDPSEFLFGLEIERRGEDNEVRSALSKRLIELGFTSREADIKARPLMHEVEIAPDELEPEQIHGPVPTKYGSDNQVHGLLKFRQILNDETRHLFQFAFLSKYRYKPTRRPPRLTVYVVGDVEEPFVRTSLRALLREVHAELLRAYSPIFESFREGFDRSLSIIPLLWMPHPADAFGGLHPLENRCEEAAIIESIQGIRRWVETVPRGTRCIPQVLINSRVTDNAVLSRRDAVRQTRDFITFQIRNDLSREAWLRQTVIGPSGDDFFASFSCHEIEFPAERAREYLANRLSRDMIAQIKRGDSGELPEIDEEPLEPPDINQLLREPTAKTRKQTRKASESTGALVEEAIDLTFRTGADELERAFDESFEQRLLEQIFTQWRTLTRSRGEMDTMMNTLRRATSDELGEALKVVRKSGDHLIDTHASIGGLKAAQAGFNQLEGITRENLNEAEQLRQRSEELCRRHSIPQTAPIGQGRESLVDLCETKPDHQAMQFGMFVWALIVPGLGAPLCYLLAQATGLPQKPNVAEFILGPLGPIVGGLILFIPAFFLLRRHMNKIVERIRQQILDLAQTAREVVEGSGSSFSGSPSIRSFIESRLHMTATLNSRNFALRVHERVVQDAQLAHRLSRSVDIQQDTLTRRAEDLGVRAQMMQSTGAEAAEDDVSQLFSTRDGQLLDFLVRPRQLQSFYLRRYGDEKERQAMVPEFIEQVGGFSQWRKQACMADTARILRYTRDLFEEIISKPVAEQYTFEEDVGDSLQHFVAANYSNIGFGAKFRGYEGIDPDGVQVLCQAALVIHPALRRVFEEAKKRPGAKPFTETLDIMETQIIPNAAYMLSFARGIRPHSMRNLMRFESFHDRVHLPDDRTFPLSGERDDAPEQQTLNRLAGFEALRDSLNASVLDQSRFHGHISTPPDPDVIDMSAPEPSSVGLVDLRDFFPIEELTPEQLAGL